MEDFDELDTELYIPHTATKTGRKYHERPFVFVDGEGVNHGMDAKQSYVLFGASTGERLYGYDLSTQQLFTFMIDLKRKHPDALFVGFALNYDVNMMLRDIPVNRLERLRKGKRVRWRNFTMHYMAGKRFAVTDNDNGLCFTMSDVFTFFACSFVQAIHEYIGLRPELAMIWFGKQQRGVFKFSELYTLIEPYMSLELALGVELCERLRIYMRHADIIPRGWHGPGAVATALLKREKVKSTPVSKLVTEYSRHAYFGGRFEMMRTGYYDGPVWQYDIRSAYPYALTLCPDLRSGEWAERDAPTDDNTFKLYELRYRNNDASRTNWHPLPMRSVRHTVHYQGWVYGIYWGPEAQMVLKAYPACTEIIRVLEYENDGTRPFEFVHEMYDQRAQWKSEGNPAQLALKLGLNSLYGKLAQRVGWDEETRKPPPSHQLEWAGFVTSVCRARMLEMMLQEPSSIVAIETDGVFSTKPLLADVGKGLGQYELEEWDGIIYVQSGVYFKRKDGEWITSKTRGFGKNTIKATDAMAASSKLHSLVSTQQRFVGMAYADTDRWRQFRPHDHRIEWGGNGKRYHDRECCDGCTDGTDWHQTVWRPGGLKSQPHTLPWRDAVVNPYQESEEMFLNEEIT